jgi:choline dehydrogenase-like flavoprotein
MSGFSEQQRRVLMKMGTLLLGELADNGSLDRAVQAFEQWQARLEPSARFILQSALAAWNLIPLFSRHLSPFAALPPDEALKFVESIRDPYRLMVMRIVKGLAGMAFLSEPAIAKRLGFEFAPMRTPTAPPPPLPPLRVVYPNDEGTVTVDVVVVGSGAGGATVAARLAEAGLQVALVEEGALAPTPALPVDGEGDPTQLPLNERVRLFYRHNGFTFTVGVPPIFTPMGCAVGGTTVINSGTCFRTPDFVLKRWQQVFGVRELEREALEPIFERIEQDLSIQPVPESVLGGNGQVLRRGAERLGVRHAPLNRPQRDCHGSGICAFVCPRNAKLDMRLTYLPRACAAGAVIYARCRAERIVMEGDRAVGVTAQIVNPPSPHPSPPLLRGERAQGVGGFNSLQPTGQYLHLRARHGVVMAAGTLYTPLLLKASGIRHPHLGRHLHLHPSLSLFAEMEEPVFGWRGVMQSYGVTEWIEQGTLIEATFPPLAMGYALHPLPFWGERHQTLLQKGAFIAAVGILTADEASEGRVFALPSGHAAMRYRLHPADIQRIVTGMAKAARLLLTAGAQAVYTDVPGLERLETLDDIERLNQRRWHPGYLNLSAYHPAGTCRMGELPSLCPADSFGRVRGMRNLWVADASLIPTPTVVNPQVTIMALAHRVADAILEQA